MKTKVVFLLCFIVNQTITNAQEDLIGSDEYSYVRGSHLAMCHDWRFNIDYLKKMSGYVWPIQTLSNGQMIRLNSYVRGYYNEKTLGTTIMFVVNSNLTYVMSFGTRQQSNSAIFMVSKITNGEPQLLFNQIVDKIRVPNDNNLYLEDVGNEKFSMTIEDKIFVRNIYFLSGGVPLNLYEVDDYKFSEVKN